MPLSRFNTTDFWRVNSYGYPNPFSAETKAHEAWSTLLTFIARHDSSYEALKAFWNGSDAPRRLDGHAVESWKATFEEFGLLYVISRSDRITVTPAGRQLQGAAEQGDQSLFAWIGINLLFRYPLQGPPRRSRGDAYANSDVLPYRFLYSLMRATDNYFWWSELERVICRVFRMEQAQDAVLAIAALRAEPSLIAEVPLPAARRRGAFYNSLNQVANHAGMNHFVLLQDNDGQLYSPPESKRRHVINRSFISVVNKALGDSSEPTACARLASYVERLPRAPSFDAEQDYFDYLGAEVPPLAPARRASVVRTLEMGGDQVPVLRLDTHFVARSAEQDRRCIAGPTASLCELARGSRIILSDDLSWTYIVLDKTISSRDHVSVTLRRARPITNADPIKRILEELDGPI